MAIIFLISIINFYIESDTFDINFPFIFPIYKQIKIIVFIYINKLHILLFLPQPNTRSRDGEINYEIL